MRILVVIPYYPPDIGISAPMLSMLVENLVSAGHQVTVLPAAPHFPSGRVAQEYRRRLWIWEDHNGVRVGCAWL